MIYELAGYASYHFTTEEAYLKQYGYRALKSHLAAHREYTFKIHQLMRKLENPRTNMTRLSEEIANFSVRWLTRHLLEKDRQYSEWLHQRYGRAIK